MKGIVTALVIGLTALGTLAADSRVPSTSQQPAPAASGAVKPTKKAVTVVVIDMGRIVREAAMSRAIQADFQAWGDSVKATMQPKADALKAKQEALKNEGAKLTADQKQTREKEIALLQSELGQIQQKAQQEYQGRQQAAEERLRAAFEPVLDALGKEYGWDIILNKGGDKLVWSSEAVDQTDLVLARFNAANPAPAPAPAAAAPATAVPAPKPAK